MTSRPCSPPAAALDVALLSIIRKVTRIMTTQSEAAAALGTVAATLDKVSAETTSLLVEIATLKDLAAAAGQTVSPELQAAIDAVATRAAAIDALVPDEPPAAG